jgi:hypothetical protein
MGFVTVQIGSGIARHCQYIKIKAKLENRTYVLRSIGRGTNFVHHFLNAGLAMTLCWMAKILIKMTFANNPRQKVPAVGGVSIAFGTTILPTKPIA